MRIYYISSYSKISNTEFPINTMTSKTIPDNMLRHLEYLRNLYLEGPRLGNIYLEDTALI